MNNNELVSLQMMPLDLKIATTKARLMDAMRQFTTDGLYLSISGGKDSLVLHSILKELEIELYGKMLIPRVFCNTGLEYPQLVENLKDIFKDDPIFIMIKPKKTFYQILTKYGYPVVSKEQSQYIREYRTSKSVKVKNIRFNGNDTGRGKISEKWKYLIDSDFKISEQCCYHMKKSPFYKYEKDTGRIPILGLLANESELRRQMYLKGGGCNSFFSKRPTSKPIGFWRESDILQYILDYDIKIPSVYGKIINRFNRLELTGTERTSCVFCMFGSHQDNGKKFINLKETNPKLYDYCMDGGKYDEEGFWIPSNGLGMRKVLKDLGLNFSDKEGK